MENVKMWTEGVDVDPGALEQIRKVASLPVLAGHIAIMPDVHVGKGAVVGSVIPTRAAVIPASVGVDIGCGMCAVMTTLTANDLPDSLKAIRSGIERAVPVGFGSHRDAPDTSQDDATGVALKARMDGLRQRFEPLRVLQDIRHFDRERVWKQCGTLGGGNHFIELCLDEGDRVWVMLHSGSRNAGNVIGQTAITTARELALKNDVHLPDRDLAWLDEGTAEFDAYVEGMHWAQDYAALNRDLMMHGVLKTLNASFARPVGTVTAAVNCHHNFTQREEHFGESIWVTRKGATSAKAGELGIIPGSMGARSFIVRGKGHADSYASCSHGAGRKLSRTAAKKVFSTKDLEAQTAGIECRKDEGVLDEIPGAYKSIEQVMKAQSDLVEVVHTLKQVLCVKG